MLDYLVFITTSLTVVFCLCVADNLRLLAELPELLIPVLDVSWQKTFV